MSRPGILLPMLILLLLCSSGHATTAPAAGTDIELKRLGGLKSLFFTLHGREPLCQTLVSPTTQRAGAPFSVTVRQVGNWQQFVTVAAAVLGTDAPLSSLTASDACEAFHGRRSVRFNFRPGISSRDRYVERLYILGYTPREIADILLGRITLRVLQQAQSMRALGYGESRINAYLERHSRPRLKKQPVGQRPNRTTVTRAVFRPLAQNSERSHLDRLVQRQASRYGVDANLIRAVISNESSWRPQIRSHAGAIGLMQLMPATAKMLGVDPKRPEENIEGGVRYLAGLLEMFDGDVDAALVAYNAGPGHARKWLKGKTVLYGETRTYLQRVKQSYASRSF